eukprot:847083_1
MLTYIWKIPSTNSYPKDLLTYGYIRQNTSRHIIDPIIHLFASYYDAESFTLLDIQHARNLQLFVSPIFTYRDFKWYLELHPNGSNLENEGSVILYLCLVMIPTHIRKLSISFELALAETDTSFRRIKTFDANKWYMGWRRDTLRLSDIQHLEHLTFRVELTLISITKQTVDEDRTTESTTLCKIYERYDGTKNIQTLSPICWPIATYKWWVTDAQTVHRIRSCDVSEHLNGPIMCFGPFKWYLQFIPKQPKMRSPWIGFRIWYCPPSVQKCLCKISIIFNELSILKSTYKLFERKGLLSVWAVTFTDKEYQMYNTLQSYSFTVDISIVDMIYNDEQKMAVYPTQFTPLVMQEFALFDYEWKIEGAELRAMQQASNVFSFTSSIFEAYSLKWYLSVWPNGSRESRKGNINIFLLLVSFYNICLKVPIKFELEWCESGKICTEYQMFRVDQCCGGETIWPLKHKDIAQLNAITLKLRICIADIMINNELITNEFMQQNGNSIAHDVCVPCEVFVWEVEPELLRVMKLADNPGSPSYESDVFEMYNMQWHVSCYPNGTKQETMNHVMLKIHLLELPTENAIISVRYAIFIEQSETRYAGEATFRREHLTSSWDTERIATDRFRELNAFSIRLDLELIDVFDAGYRITNKYLPTHYYYDSDKLSDTERWTLEMDEMDYTIANARKVMDGSAVNDEKDEPADTHAYAIYDDGEQFNLQEWFCEILNMPQYYNAFIECGIHDLKMITALNDKSLMEIGVLTLHHRTKILIEIAILTLMTK